MKKYYKICIFFFICSGFSSHKFYVGLTQCDYVPKQKVLQITTRAFIDDLQEEINLTQQTNIELATEREPANINNVYQKYLQNHLQFVVNDTLKAFQYIGKEYKGNTVIFYLEIDSIVKIEMLKITNRILIRTFEQQKNIVQTKIYDQKKSFIFSCEEKTRKIF